MEFHVEATGVADRLPLCVSPPQGGGGGVTVGAGQAHPSRGRLPQVKEKKGKSFLNYQREQKKYVYTTK